MHIFFGKKDRARLSSVEQQLAVLQRRFEVAEGNLVSNGVACQTIAHSAATVLDPHNRGSWLVHAHDEQLRCGVLEAIPLIAKYLGIEFIKTEARETITVAVKRKGKKRPSKSPPS